MGVSERIVCPIKSQAVDPYNFERLQVLALKQLGAPIIRVNFQMEWPGYNPSEDELVVTQEAEQVEIILDLITIPDTQRLSVARSVAYGQAQRIQPLLNEDPLARECVFRPQVVADIEYSEDQIEFLKRCYVAAFNRMPPHLHNHNFDAFYEKFLKPEGVTAVPPEELGAWMSLAYASRLREIHPRLALLKAS